MMPRLSLCILAVLTLLPFGTFHAQGSESRDAYVSSNLLAALYHGLGHALIDTMELAPGFEVERRAAELSVLLVDRFYEERAAADMALDTAFGFSERYEARQQAVRPSPYWHAHGTGLERYYDLLCLFAGGNLVERSDLVLSLGLFASRLPGCPDEFTAAIAEWSPVLSRMEDLHLAGRGHPLVIESRAELPGAQRDVLAFEIQALNTIMRLPRPFGVIVDRCYEANIHWLPEQREIIVCVEYVTYLYETAMSR
ncbi:DUF4344 domain-containing metallopeptidase [Profundibacterium mesophilum]|uniref:Uncharacterized protein n=1 Tax=Profundibacterium mesophilum KAUST100406-0324 TaxID=1037889 RepID=A0A921TEI4_9RHOB|nr:DUF4344 domain-containing metallopeptidase [Profundibacterium mesophilum]KAF0677341.1 hypothetical protein PMES_00252 [Profundibacterium mesophilum KAUST100406-0324]